MEFFTEFINQNVALAHWPIFGLLLLAGFNLPVSEDAMLFISAVLASKYPSQLPHLFLAVYLGAYLSDLICYQLGKHLGPKLWKINFFSKMVSMDRVKVIESYYSQYGFLTLVLGRFIPFGVRNGLFLTAGLAKMNFLRFAISDFIACTISCSVYFYLYFTYGNSVISVIQKGNLVIFGLAITVVLFLVTKKIIKSKR